MALTRKHSHGVVENLRPSLYALIQPARTMFLLVDGYGKSLPSAVVDGIDDRNVEFVWVLSQMLGA